MVDTPQMELAKALSTQARMLLEDASVKIILVGRLDRSALSDAIGEAREMVTRATALLVAAAAVLEEGR